MLAMRRACAARTCQNEGSDDRASAMARLIKGRDGKWWREKMRSTILVILPVSSPSSDSVKGFRGPHWSGRHVNKQKLLFQPMENYDVFEKAILPHRRGPHDPDACVYRKPYPS
jgi:hypothetical protein